MTTHVGRLLDRHTATGRCILRVQDDYGTCLDVRVDFEDSAAAADLYGGACVHWTYRGGRAFWLGVR